MRHPLLLRQLRRLAADPGEAPTSETWRAFLERIDRTYQDVDRDRYTLERSLAISSAEMQQLYEKQRESTDRLLSVQRDELELTAAIMSSAIEAAPDGILVVDRRRRVVAFNRRFAEMWKIPVELRSRPEDGALLAFILAQMSEAEEVPRREILDQDLLRSGHDEIVLRDGRCVDRLCEPLLSDAGAGLGRVWFFRDISARKQAEATLQERVVERTRELSIAEDHLRSARKVEVVGRLAGGVAHDFNNILAVVLSYSEMLLETVEDAAARADLEQIQKAAIRGAGLTQQLLAFSRQQVLRPERIDLNPVVEDMERMLIRLIGEDIRYQAHLHPEISTIQADPGQIQQVLMNLVVNARDAMPRGGTLTVTTSIVEVSAEEVAAHDDVRAGTHVALTVVDTGEGMDEATLQRIFEPFFTTKPRGQGTGLGLATVFGIVKQSGGHIAVESRVGRGTTFSVRFPAVAAAPDRSSASDTVPATGAERILLVEDEDAVREAARRILQRAGYEVTDFASGPAALAALAASADVIDLVLTDVVMPAMSGCDLAAAILAQRPGMRVLFMSGYTEHALLTRGAIAEWQLLDKPFTPRQLLARVREALDG